MHMRLPNGVQGCRCAHLDDVLHPVLAVFGGRRLNGGAEGEGFGHVARTVGVNLLEAGFEERRFAAVVRKDNCVQRGFHGRERRRNGMTCRKSRARARCDPLNDVKYFDQNACMVCVLSPWQAWHIGLSSFEIALT